MLEWMVCRSWCTYCFSGINIRIALVVLTSHIEKKFSSGILGWEWGSKLRFDYVLDSAQKSFKIQVVT